MNFADTAESNIINDPCLHTLDGHFTDSFRLGRAQGKCCKYSRSTEGWIENSRSCAPSLRAIWKSTRHERRACTCDQGKKHTVRRNAHIMAMGSLYRDRPRLKSSTKCLVIAQRVSSDKVNWLSITFSIS